MKFSSMIIYSLPKLQIHIIYILFRRISVSWFNAQVMNARAYIIP